METLVDTQAIFLLQLALSLVAWGVVGAFLLSPRLAALPRREALTWLLVPHAFRHVGLVFLVPGVVDQPLPLDFAGPAAYGDLAAGLLALVAIVALRLRWPAALAAVWLAHLVGAVDLANALRHVEVVPLLGSTWYIPTMVVPLLLVTHAMSLRLLLARPRLVASGDIDVALAGR